MKKFFKWLSIILLAILSLLAAVIIALPLLIDPNDFKDEITSAVKDRTGRTLTIEGDIRLSVFPWLGLQLGKTQLSNAPGFDQQPMLQLENVKLGVKLLPLLRQQLQTDETILQGVKVNLQRNASGQTNWDDLTGMGEKQSSKKTKDDKAVSAAPLAAFAIGGLQLQDASIQWDDQQTKQLWQVSNLDLTTGAIAWGKAFPLKLSFSAQAQHLKARTELKLAADITLYENQQLRVQEMNLVQQLWSPQLPASPMTLQARLSRLDFDNQGQTLKLKQLRLQNGTLVINANATVEGIMSAPSFQGEVTIPQFNPRQWLSDQQLALPANLPANALTRLQSQMHLSGSTQSLKLERLKLTLDNSHLSGDLSLPRLAPASYRYQLSMDKFDVDAYLPPKQEKAAASPAAGAAAASQLPMELLRGLDIDGTFDIGLLKVSNLNLQKVETRLFANKGQLRLHPLKAQLYQGQYSGDIQLNALGAQPVITTNETLQRVALGPLLKDFIGDDKLHGTTNLQARLTTRGSDIDSFKQHLTGDVSTDLHDGYLKGIDIDYAERKLSAQIKGQPIPPKPAKPRTGFSKLEAAFRLDNGLAHTRTLTAQLPHARMQGSGDIDLVKDQLNMTLNFKFSSKVQGQEGKAYDELERIALPVHLRGPLAQPDYDIDFDGALKAILKQKLQRQKEAEKARLEQKLQQEKSEAEQKVRDEQQKLKEEFKQKADDFLKNLLKR